MASSNHHSPQAEGLALGVGILLGPLAWFLHQQVSYLLVSRACATGSLVLLYVWSAAMLLVVGGGASLSWKSFKRAAGGRSDGGDEVLDRFLALGGLMSSGLFSALIVAQWVPTILVDPCAR